jgi:hypothetical protein
MENRSGRRIVSLSFILLAAAWAAYAAFKLLAIDDRMALNLAFAIEVLLVSLIYRRLPLNWSEINSAIAVFILFSTIAFIAGAFLLEANRDIAYFIGSPINSFGYYPPGADVPFFAGAPIWAVSIYILCVISFLLGRALGAALPHGKDPAGLGG